MFVFKPHFTRTDVLRASDKMKNLDTANLPESALSERSRKILSAVNFSSQDVKNAKKGLSTFSVRIVMPEKTDSEG